MIKRILAAALAVITIASLLPFSVSAAGEMKLAAKSVTASASESSTVEVPVSFSGNPGYGYGYISVSWNQTAMKLTDVKYTDLAPKQASAAPLDTEGYYKVSFGDMLTLDPFRGDGTAFTLVFSVQKGAAAGDYEVKLHEPEIYDVDINPIKATASNAKVTLKNDGKPAQKEKTTQAKKSEQQSSKAKTDKQSSSSQGSGQASSGSKAAPVGMKLSLSVYSAYAEKKTGETVSVPVRFLENPGYSYGFVTVKWDKSALKLNDIAYTAIAPSQSKSLKPENSGEYKIGFGVFNGSENFTGTGTAFTLNFEVTDAAQAKVYEVSFKNAEVYDKDLQAVKTELSGAKVDLSGKKHAHKLKKVNRTVPTCTSYGVDAYYICEDCGKLFADEKGEKEIDKPVTKPALGHKLKKIDGEDYYVCEYCGKKFEDEKAEKPLDEPAQTATSSKAQSKSNPGSFLWFIAPVLVAAVLCAGVVIVKKRGKKTAQEPESDTDGE